MKEHQHKMIERIEANNFDWGNKTKLSNVAFIDMVWPNEAQNTNEDKNAIKHLKKNSSESWDSSLKVKQKTRA